MEKNIYVSFQIDEQVIALMTPEQLRDYLPKYGDRLALIAFSKQTQGAASAIEGSERKSTLFDKLRARLEMKKKGGPNEHVRRAAPQAGNKNAKKMKRNIELKWVHSYNDTTDLKQVRAPNGGGPRTVNVDLSNTCEEVLQMAKDLFFPNGISKKGKVEEFHVFLTDQNYTKLDNNCTLNEVFQSTLYKNLKLNMATVPINLTQSHQSSIKTSASGANPSTSQFMNSSETHTESGSSLTSTSQSSVIQCTSGCSPSANQIMNASVANTESGSSLVSGTQSSNIHCTSGPSPSASELINISEASTVTEEQQTLDSQPTYILQAAGSFLQVNSVPHIETGSDSISCSSYPVDNSDENTRFAVEYCQHLPVVVGAEAVCPPVNSDEIIAYEVAVANILSQGNSVITSNESVVDTMKAGGVESDMNVYDDKGLSEFCDQPNVAQAVEENNLLVTQVLAESNVSSEEGVFTITLHRTVLWNEMIQYFKSEDIINMAIKFRFIDELGHDADGVSRDAYTAFWERFFLSNADGETRRVPVLSNDLGQEEWESIGRILVKGYKDHKYFPTTFAPAFCVALIHGENSVSPDVLKSSFLDFLSPSEKDVIEAALDGKAYDEEELICILDRFQCHVIPKVNELLACVHQIAHKVLIQEPKYALDAMSNIGEEALRSFFPEVESVIKMYEHLEPTASRVIKLLQANPSSQEESKSLGFLHQFIRGRNKIQLRRLLRLLTGSDVICVEKIEINFIAHPDRGGLPSIHTCGPMLELPSTYRKFPDFRSEWESILENPSCMEMHIA